MQNFDYSPKLRQELMFHVRKVLGPIATPDHIHWAPGLPKTRSGKIMRRILRKITTDQTSPEHLGGACSSSLLLAFSLGQRA